MKIKVIDLLVKIANNEEVPKKIKLKNFEEIYTLREDCTGYKWYGEEKTNNEFGETIHKNLEYILKQDIEILEEPKKIEKINRNRYPGTDIDPLDDILDKLDELIDAVNELKRDK